MGPARRGRACSALSPLRGSEGSVLEPGCIGQRFPHRQWLIGRALGGGLSSVPVLVLVSLHYRGLATHISFATLRTDLSSDVGADWKDKGLDQAHIWPFFPNYYIHFHLENAQWKSSKTPRMKTIAAKQEHPKMEIKVRTMMTETRKTKGDWSG